MKHLKTFNEAKTQKLDTKQELQLPELSLTVSQLNKALKRYNLEIQNKS